MVFVVSYGSGKLVIGVLGEFDVLFGVLQVVVFYLEVWEELVNGYVCGYYFFGMGLVVVVIVIKDWFDCMGSFGIICFYGMFVEEGGVGKVYMVRVGLFDDVDVVLYWYLGDGNSVDVGFILFNMLVKFCFYGQVFYVVVVFYCGCLVLDGVEVMNYMVNLMCEYVMEQMCIYYVIMWGGEVFNVVLVFVEVFYYVCYFDWVEVKCLFECIVFIVEGVVRGMEMCMEYEIIYGLYNLFFNWILVQFMY